jgi:hypothetical protein
MYFVAAGQDIKDLMIEELLKGEVAVLCRQRKAQVLK